MSRVSRVEVAIRALKRGEPVMVFDGWGREEEVDLVFHASSVTWREVSLLRRVAGGLICYATRYDLLKKLGIPFLHEALAKVPSLAPLAERRLSYGDPPAFVLWVNHRSVKTGISDVDRAKTIAALHRLTQLLIEGDEKAVKFFQDEFVVPGHVALLGSRGLEQRRGHTELSVALAEMAGLSPSVVFAEMLSDHGESMGLDEAERFSRLTGIPLVTGDEIIEAWWEWRNARR
ncbi:34-dihydroxy-2-butanone 4-phosphate synthase [Pyrolobus fumarii 1A]|uniref:34-dihydroxy-2-butanone 4-phosphate synthase n=1 Tax=Pyrolobus fumarii (strain DSM 11204 / 1A) TaxID=694429 RepID=G0EGE8_PYRF1|nr:3,4-dihydroxy-2-butanone-4-phosphate synthase [Pyrolobus fumarii]AEM39173.1 34-dihydroxy-2-butanone 4-phosphate synthase [Pyrolobus fumarii 1A]